MERLAFDVACSTMEKDWRSMLESGLSTESKLQHQQVRGQSLLAENDTQHNLEHKQHTIIWSNEAAIIWPTWPTIDPSLRR